MIRLVLASVRYYWKTAIAVILALTVSTAVIGGSLIVGDSVRSSLQQMSLKRLGTITHILSSHRFFRQDLAAEIQSEVQHQIVPAVIVTGTVEFRKPNAAGASRTGSTTILGLPPEAWNILDHGATAPPSAEGVVLGARTATELGVQPGDQVTLWIERPSSIPRDSLLGEREELSIEIIVTVSGLLTEEDGASRFSLNPGQQLPHTAFIGLELLQDRLGIQAVEASRRNPIAKPARVNTLLAGPEIKAASADQSEPDRGSPNLDDSGLSNSELKNMVTDDLKALEKLTTALRKKVQLVDAGLLIRKVSDRGYLTVESESMILDDHSAEAVLGASERMGLEASPALVYLANELRAADHQDQNSRYSMYSIIAGLPYQLQTPLGPFLLNDGTPIPQLGADEIVLSHWLSQDLQVSAGDEIEARWHEVGSHGDLPETHQRFRVRGVLNAEDPISIDQDLTPFVDGVTNVASFSDWDQPFEMEMDRITARDDEYWEQHRATPKAFVSAETAQRLWQSRFGKYTSIRIASPGVALPEERLLDLSERLEFEIQSTLKPERLGFYYRPVRAEGLQASVGANDFTQLFLAFSFFLILSAIVLAVLMYRLGIQQRVAQIGLMEALGFTHSTARRLFVAEGLVMAVFASLLGAIFSVLFARLMIYGLTNWWVGAVGTRFLILDVQPLKLIIAAGITIILAVGVIWQSVWSMTKRSPVELLRGGGEGGGTQKASGRRLWKFIGWRIVFAVMLLTAILLPALAIRGLLPAREAFGGMTWKVVGFFLAGFSWLVTGLMTLEQILARRNGEMIKSTAGSMISLVIANTARHPQRSLLTAALIAFATFVIVAVGAGRRNPVSETPDKSSGNGGFSLVAETSQPILLNLNSAEDRTRLGIDSTTSQFPQSTSVYSFRVKPGQDASCLNLYQTVMPTLLGARDEFITRGGFRFANTPGENPWRKLNEPVEGIAPLSTAASPQDLEVIPVIGDMNTLQFSLKKGIGDRILYPNETTPRFAMQIVGMLDSSVFQGVLVMSEANLKKLSPENSGFQYFLIDTGTNASDMQQVSGALEEGLSEFGFDAEPVSQRLAGFLAVQNTYLSTFQMLGSLGLLVGTLGLAAVMIRNVVERRRELGLMKALGFPSTRIMAMVLWENCTLLFWGMITGSASALIAMLPHLQSTGADIDWATLAITLGSVVLTGSLAAVFPVLAAARFSIREAISS
ncbi:MAG: ABC transporter permease [Planctomyces sp.]|nr:ABC transporter permease [Planctomyces sp.]